MKIIICVDDNNGISFNKRRQSRDKALIADIFRYIDNKCKLQITEYSSSLFADYSENIIIENDFLSCDDDGYCFFENSSIESFKDKVSEVILYKWNRLYPADLYFDSSILKNMKLAAVYDFCGNSHERITREVYKK